MAIRQTKYIDITSGVGGASAVSDRELIARVFTTNELCGIGHVYEFKDLSSVMEHFGSTSAEYKTAAKYFGFVAKDIVAPKKMSFFGYSTAAKNAYVQATVPYEATYSKYEDSNCKLKLRLGIRTVDIPVTFTSITSVNDVFSAVAAAISAVEGFNGTTCTVPESPGSKVRITFPSGIQEEILGFQKADTTTDDQDDLAVLLGVGMSADPVTSNYTAGETPLEALVRSDGISDNFGSFYFLEPTTDDEVSKSDARDVAAWNMAKNYKYLYIVGRQGYTTAQGGLEGDVADWAAKDTGLKGYVGTTLWAYKTKDDCIESLPAALFATTDYSRANSTQTYMYQMNDLISAAITNDKTSQKLDDLNVNYMGVTQSAGGLIQFTQDGNNMDGVETGVYCNEVWMKAAFWTAIMNLFLAVKKVPANDEGAGLIKTVMMPIITTAIKNGTIMPRKPLTTTQKVYIGQVTGNSEAWMDVYNDGYTLEINIENVDNRFVAKYILVYSKGDAVRKVEGTDILI